MLAILLGLFRLVWLFGRGHHAVALENLALRQQLAIYKRKKQRPRLVGPDRWFWVVLLALSRDWRKPLFVVHPDTVVRWQRERFRRYWAQRSKKLGRLAQLSEKKIALLQAIAKSEENEFNPAPFVQKFHPQYFKRLGDSGLLIRAGRGRYKLYHPLFRQFLRQQP